MLHSNLECEVYEQGILEAVKQDMTRVKIDILGISAGCPTGTKVRKGLGNPDSWVGGKRLEYGLWGSKGALVVSHWQD